MIVILEDNAARVQVMRAALASAQPELPCRFFNSARALIEWLADHLDSVRLLSLDHDLDFLPGPNGQLIDPGDGREVACFLAGRKPCSPVIIHTSNSEGAESMELTLQDAGWQVARVCPADDLVWVKAQWLPTLLRAVRKPHRAE